MGGPFSPNALVLTLANGGSNSLGWAAGSGVAWLSLSAGGGTLLPGGPPATVTVSLTAAVNSLPAGNYGGTVWVTNLADLAAEPRQFTLIVLGAPIIATQPQNQLVVTGDNPAFTVLVWGGTPLGYCWQRNGVPIPDATEATYVAQNVQLSDSGSQFNCVVTNGFGAATSSIAPLVVVSAPFCYFSGTNGSGPNAGLVQGADGNFYGSTINGGALGDGTVFQLTPQGTLTTLVSFDGTNGANPLAALVPGGDGNFYGTTENGGTYNNGTVFRLTTNGLLTTLASFDATNGPAYPGALVPGNDGNFYGVTGGGLYDCSFGSVFKVTTNGALTDLYCFNFTDGETPGGLVLGSDGRLYGTTSTGGALDDGTVFQMTTNGALTTLISFSGTNGAYPGGNLIQSAGGNFYGTTPEGWGVGNGYGSVFQLSTNGALTTLASFSYTNGTAPNGAFPVEVVAGLDGNFYGATAGVLGDTAVGGTNAYGTVFRLTPTGVLTTLFTFAGINGVNLTALMQGTDGNLYITAYLGGPGYQGGEGGSNGNGTIFRLCELVDEPPVITAPPQNQYAPEGGSATFSVAALGVPPLQYQWQFQGANIPGATNASYTLGNAAASGAGGYDVMVTDAYGSVTSSVAVLTTWLPPGFLAYGGQLVVFYPSAGNGSGSQGNYQLQACTNPAAGNWMTVATGISWSGLAITNGPDTAFFRLSFVPPAVTSIGIAFWSNQPVVMYSASASQSPSLVMTTNLVSGVWTPCAGGIAFTGFPVTNPVSATYYRLVTSEAISSTRAAAGAAHTLFLRSDGSLWGMGRDLEGELGDGRFSSTNLPEQIVASNVVAMAAGDYHSLYLKADGSLWAMGDDVEGQLGDGATVPEPNPEQIVASNVVAIAAGGNHSLFLERDGSLWGMGRNVEGEVGDGTYNPVLVPEEIVPHNVVAVAAGAFHSLFLKSDGSLWAMGLNFYGALGDGTDVTTNRPEQILPGNVTAIAAGYDQSFFLKSDGTLWAMGRNAEGELGDGTYNNSFVPEQIQPGNVSAVSAGAFHTLILKRDGSLWSTGYNLYGQLGDGNQNTVNVFTQVVSNNVVGAVGGGAHSLFLLGDGTLWGMGWNDYGQLGNGSDHDADLPTPVLTSPITSDPD